MDVASTGPRLARLCIATELALLAVGLPVMRACGLRVELGHSAGPVVGWIVLSAMAAYYRWVRPADAFGTAASETLLALLLLVLASTVTGMLQYPAVALDRPLIDPWLARADAMLGVHVPSLAAWTSAHPVVDVVLRVAYFTLLLQFTLPLIVLGVGYRDVDAVHEYAFHFHFCAVVTVLALAVFPAECAFQHYGFESTIGQDRFIEHFNALRAGTLHVVHLDDIEGLVSVPSFHTAGALMVTWAFRRRRAFLLPLLVCNALLIAATFMSGAHYVVDVLVSAALFAASVRTWRWWRGEGGAARVSIAAVAPADDATRAA